MGAAENLPWSKEEFEQKLRAKDKRYHIYHPFHIAMNGGGCTPEQVRGWVANRFYYQIMIPIKDSAIMANMPDRDHRRLWIQRIIDHDGNEGEEGGIEAWLALADAVGLKRDEVISLEHVLPGVRFAVDAYVNFARRAPWQEAVCSSLTELFAPTIHQKRLDTWPDHYPWIEPQGYAYFRKRLSEARRDVEHGLRVTLDHFRTREEQERALGILQFKLDVLWTMLDAMQVTYGIGEQRTGAIERMADE
ncbi:MAG: pyrroloquinoline-quinone synthase PqqC [Betaproteobacteria bacterium]|nr:MAG: pyrroloquinoline-quinone synthase PqqC [Betaproteobacteria bacterium]